MKQPKHLLISLFALLALANSCNQVKEAKKVGFVNPSQSLLDSISLIATNEIGDTVKSSDISQPASKGIQWKAWENWFKSCPQNATFKNDLVYLGVASSKGLGYILSKDKSIDKWDFLKISKDTAINNSFIDKGVSVAQCDLSQMSDFTFDMIAGGNILTSANARLGILVANAKKITVKAGTWRIESLQTGPFLNFINTTNDPTLKVYKEALLNTNNIVLTKVLKISGFEAEIVSADSIDAGLKATLDNGLNVNVVAKDTTRKQGFSLSFKKVSNNTVKVTSTGEFSLFGQASKGIKL